MQFWNMLSYLAWGLSGLMLLWMLVDAFWVSSQYDEDYLMSSREGLEEVVAHTVHVDGEHQS